MPDFDTLMKTSCRSGTFYGTARRDEHAYYAFFSDEPAPAHPRPSWLDIFAALRRRLAA